MDALITRLLKDDVSLEEVFALSLRAEDYLRVFKERAIVHATKHVPRVIEAMASAAIKGDVAAAKWLADVVGLVPVGGARGQGGPTVLTQINLHAPRVRDVLDVGEVEVEE